MLTQVLDATWNALCSDWADLGRNAKMELLSV